jgi:hypothetical protein
MAIIFPNGTPFRQITTDYMFQERQRSMVISEWDVFRHSLRILCSMERGLLMARYFQWDVSSVTCKWYVR